MGMSMGAAPAGPAGTGRIINALDSGARGNLLKTYVKYPQSIHCDRNTRMRATIPPGVMVTSFPALFVCHFKMWEVVDLIRLFQARLRR